MMTTSERERASAIGDDRRGGHRSDLVVGMAGTEGHLMAAPGERSSQDAVR